MSSTVVFRFGPQTTSSLLEMTILDPTWDLLIHQLEGGAHFSE